MKEWIERYTYSKPFSLLVHWPLLIFGVVAFRLTGSTPWLAYWSMRRLYCVTHGRSNRWLVRRLGRKPAEGARAAGGVLSNLSEAKRVAVVESLQQNGFHVLGQQLSQNDVHSLVSFARTTPARLRPAPRGGPEEAEFDPGRPLAIKYDLPEHRLVKHPVIQRLLADDSLRDLARRYLGCEPVNDLVAMWWSTAFSSEASSEVAQLYHFDMDRPQFLKIFFYLTDVTPDSGPHCYIRGSHRERPQALWRDGRHSDAEVLSQYGRDREVEITAPWGTLIAVDTSGFHKGKPLSRGNRLILQFEYTSALFGQRYNRIRVPATAFWSGQIAAHPPYMARFALDRNLGEDG